MKKNVNCPLFIILCCILLLVGAFCAALLLARRAKAELRSDQVACAISYADVLTLSETDGRTPAQWLDSLRNAGVAYLIAAEGDAADAEHAAQRTGLALARAGSAARPGDACLLPEMNGDLPVSASVSTDDAVPLAVAEDLSRTGVLLSPEIDADALRCPTVKTLYSFERYRSSDDYIGILYRAAAERGMRLLVLRPMLNADGALVSDPAAYSRLLGELRERMAQRGLTLGAEFSALDAPRDDRFLFIGALLALAALAVILLCCVIPLSGLLRCVLLIAAALVLAAAAYFRPALCMPLGALAAALICGCFAALLLRKLWTASKSAKISLFVLFLLALIGLLLIGVLGGLCVASLLSCRRYMLGFSVFRGVKAAQFLPLLFSAAVLIVTVRRDENARLPRGRRLTVSILVCALLAAAALLLLYLRSGDTGAFVSVWESRARDWLERTLYVRPRTKEMLLAFPCAALFAFSCRRRLPLLGVLSGVLASLAAVSVINSFCHIVTPLHVTLIRSALGALIGLVLGCILSALLALLFSGNRRTDREI